MVKFLKITGVLKIINLAYVLGGHEYFSIFRLLADILKGLNTKHNSKFYMYINPLSQRDLMVSILVTGFNRLNKLKAQKSEIICPSSQLVTIFYKWDLDGKNLVPDPTLLRIILLITLKLQDVISYEQLFSI